MRSRRPLLSGDQDARDLWPSFTDVTTTFALILFVLVLLAYVRNLVTGKKLEAFQHQITQSEARLQQLGDEVKRTNAEIEAGRRELRLSEQKVEDQQRVLAESNRELGDLRARLQSIAVLRVEVLDKVKRALEAELASSDPSQSRAAQVSVGDNGNIVVNENLVFEYNSFAIKKQGRPLLQSLARVLGNVLADPGVRQKVDTIHVLGHTDERGTPSFNRELSAKRANAVLDFMFESNRTLEDAYGSYFASSAFSEFRPLTRGTDESSYELNRRIEIAVVLKDSNVRKVIEDYINSTSAAAPTPPGQAP